MVDNKTAHLTLPLPDLSNMQDEDVPRIGGALRMLDAHAQQVDSALRGVDSALESQGREVAELKVESQTQAGSLDALSRALETEKAERSEADRVSGFDRGDPATRWQNHAIAATNGILTVDEIREVEGYSPLPKKEKMVGAA